jgi:hypothetical protein
MWVYQVPLSRALVRMPIGTGPIADRSLVLRCANRSAASACRSSSFPRWRSEELCRRKAVGGRMSRMDGAPAIRRYAAACSGPKCLLVVAGHRRSLKQGLHDAPPHDRQAQSTLSGETTQRRQELRWAGSPETSNSTYPSAGNRPLSGVMPASVRGRHQPCVDSPQR